MARPSGTPGKKKVAFPLLSRIESLPVLLAILCFGILAGAGPELRSSRYVFEPPWLLLVLNTVFITGLGVLISGLKRVRTHGGDFALVCTEPRILKVFEITGLVQVFPMHESVDQAVAA